MNINFKQALTNFEGEELKEPDAKKVEELRKQLASKEINQDEFNAKLVESFKVVTLGFICVNALLSEIKDERNTGEDKVKRYELAKAIHMNDELDVPAEGIVLLKERIGKLYLPMIVGQTFDLLENKSEGKTDVRAD